MSSNIYRSSSFNDAVDRQLLFAICAITVFCFTFITVNSGEFREIPEKGVSSGSANRLKLKFIPGSPTTAHLPALSVQSSAQIKPTTTSSSLQTNVAGENSHTGDASSTINLQADKTNQDPETLNIQVPAKQNNVPNSAHKLIVK